MTRQRNNFLPLGTTATPPQRSAFARAGGRRRGMTLLDVALVLVAIAIVLSAAVSVCDALVNDSADRQTTATLMSLDNAMQLFNERHAAWPSGSEPEFIDTPMARCVAALRSSPATDKLVTSLPGLSYTPGRWFTVHDGFGRVMMYVNPQDTHPEMVKQAGRFPRSPQSRPFIVSAGADGRFGDLSADDPALRFDVADNLYSYEQEVAP